MLLFARCRFCPFFYLPLSIAFCSPFFLLKKKSLIFFLSIIIACLLCLHLFRSFSTIFCYRWMHCVYFILMLHLVAASISFARHCFCAFIFVEIPFWDASKMMFSFCVQYTRFFFFHCIVWLLTWRKRIHEMKNANRTRLRSEYTRLSLSVYNDIWLCLFVSAFFGSLLPWCV